jgi:hypothetical protein
MKTTVLCLNKCLYKICDWRFGGNDVRCTNVSDIDSIAALEHVRARTCT